MIYRAAVASLSWFVLTVVLEHILVPQLTPARHTISEYANAGGAAGPLMVAGFVVWAGSLATTAVLTLREPHRGRPVVMRVVRNALFALLLIAAVGAIITAAFPTQAGAGLIAPGQLESNSGRLHGLGSDLIQLCLYPAVLLSLILPAPRWFAIVAVVLLVVAVAVGPALAALGVDASGARQRVQLAAACGWQFALLAAWRRGAARGPYATNAAASNRCAGR
jgi:hypothetical protein